MIHRVSQVPVIAADQVKPSHPRLKVAGIFNPAACFYQDQIFLLARVAEICNSPRDKIHVPVAVSNSGKINILEWPQEEADSSDSRIIKVHGKTYLSSLSHLRLARSSDGIRFTVDTEPFIFPQSPDENYGVEDARITKIRDTFYITYTAVSENGFGVALASTRDFKTLTRHGMILPPQNKDACLFPSKINGKYMILHRPLVEFLGTPSIWIAESPDLLRWGNHHFLMAARGNQWEIGKIGAGPEPIKTDEGWLLLYHAVDKNEKYTLHLALLDLRNPQKILNRTSRPILIPELNWEREGFYAEVVFSNGWVAFPDGRVLIYYGGADSAIGAAESSIRELLGFLNR